MENSVKAVPIEGFDPAEIYLLGKAIGVVELFGMDDKETALIKTGDSMEKTSGKLQGKGVLNPEGRLTRKGALLIRALEAYSKSEEYAQINNLSVALSKTGAEDNVVILFEDEKDTSYRIELWPRKRIISLLMDMYGFFRKPADARDFEYLIRAIEGEDLERVKKADLLGCPALSFEWFKRPREADKKIGYEHKLFFPDGGEIVQIDVVEQEYSYISLFYLYKQVFDWLNIPYGKEVLASNEPTDKLRVNR